MLLKPIIEFSTSLIAKFDAELENGEQNLDIMKIGKCILSSIDEMRVTYAQYTRSHNDINELLKKVKKYFEYF